MAATYTLANAVTEVCAKQKDYDEYRYGANDSEEYNRAKKLFWEAVIMLISPTEQLKTDYPNFYNFAENVSNLMIHGLVKSVDYPIEDGVISIPDITGDPLVYVMRVLKYGNTPGVTGNKKYIKRVSHDKIANMAAQEVYPANRLYIAEESNTLYFYPTTEVDKIRIQYIESPNNNMATTESLLDTFTQPFITKAIALASQLLEYERTRA